MFKKFDLVWSKDGCSDIFVVFSDEMEVPIFYDACGSGAAFLATDLSDPGSYISCDGYLCWNVTKNKYDVMMSHNLQKYPVEDSSVGWRPFDQATGQLKRILSLLKLGGCEVEIKQK